MTTPKGCYLLLVIPVVMVTAQDYPHAYPANDYEHSVRRDYLLRQEKQFQKGRPQLSEDEQAVNQYLMMLKWREFNATRNAFPPLRPVEEMMDQIQRSDIYRVLKMMPKGGNMHSHENHQLSKAKLFDIVWESEDIENLFIIEEDDHPRQWTLDFFIDPPTQDWIRINESKYTKEQILDKQTFIAIMDDYAKKYPTDSMERWRQMDVLWGRASTQLVANINIKDKYLDAILRQGLDEGVQYIETRKNFGAEERLYRLNSSAVETNGKQFLDDTGELDVKIALDLVEKLREEDSSFIGMNRISYTHRQNSFEVIREDMLRVSALHEKYPHHILGFDMVGQEDAGNAHLYHLDNWLELYDETSRDSSMPLYIHTAETNFPADLMTSETGDDLVGTLHNMYEVILLKSKRIGHGLGFAGHPYILQFARDMGDLAFEICPVSNQLLGFFADLRTHPGKAYMREGIPIVLGADDPGTFGYDNFTIDWYEVFMGWGVDLADMKQIALNSLIYSGMSESQKADAINGRFTPKWNTFIEEMKQESCNISWIDGDWNPSYFKVFPKEGAMEGTTNVHLFGRELDGAMCKEVMCKFGDVVSPSTIYKPPYIVECVAPAIATRNNPKFDSKADSVTVEVSISYDGGNSYSSTGLSYTYKYEEFVPDIEIETPATQEPVTCEASGLKLQLITLLLCMILKY